jgi:IPT/TIG domain
VAKDQRKSLFNRIGGFLSVCIALVVVVILGQFFFVLANKERGFVFTPRQSALWAALFLLAAAILLDRFVVMVQDAAAAQPANKPAGASPGADQGEGANGGQDKAGGRRRGIKGMVVGTDLRASTSKLQAVMWTAAVLYALTFLLLLGRLLYAGSGCPQNAQCRPNVSALAGVFDNVVKQPLKPEYFALLGFPLAGAVAAKAITTGKVASGDVLKSQSDQTGVAQGVGEVVTNDQGTVDLLDLQYTAFNIFALIYFFVALFTHTTGGLPTIPASLLALAGVSVTAYATKKALETGVGPQITAASPLRIILTQDSKLTIVGSGFVTARQSSTELNDVYLDGRSLKVDGNSWSPSRVVVKLPTDKKELKAEGFRERSDPTALAELIVQDDYGQQSDPVKIEIDVPANWDA